MNVRTTRIQADPDKAAADGGSSYRAMVESMKQVDGFLGALLLVERKTGDSLGLTFWKDEAALRASEQVANKFRRDGAATVGSTASPVVERFEVEYYGVPEPASLT